MNAAIKAAAPEGAYATRRRSSPATTEPPSDPCPWSDANMNSRIANTKVQSTPVHSRATVKHLDVPARHQPARKEIGQEDEHDRRVSLYFKVAVGHGPARSIRGDAAWVGNPPDQLLARVQKLEIVDDKWIVWFALVGLEEFLAGALFPGSTIE